MPFLQAATSDELLRTVAEYTRFLEGGARSCPSFAVELVWRTHLLMPAAYAKDCEALAGRVLDHDILPVGVYSLAAPAESESELPCDGLRLAHLVGAMRRQQSFMEKMLARRSAMDAPDYLALSVRQYGQFLALMKRHRGVMLVPTLAIDLMCVEICISAICLISTPCALRSLSRPLTLCRLSACDALFHVARSWHTHQMLPQRYAAETKILAGHFVNHDDNLEDEELAADLERTERLWQEAFGAPYLNHTAAPPAGSHHQQLHMKKKALGGITGGLMLASLAAVALLSPVSREQHEPEFARRQLQSACTSSGYDVTKFSNVYNIQSNRADTTTQVRTTIDCTSALY